MRTETYSAQTIKDFMRSHIVVTLQQIQKAIGHGSRRTVFRKFAQLDYLSSYSHGGKYYTLVETVQFDKHGLWEHNGIHFSKHGTLGDTAVALVSESSDGLYCAELDEIAGVSCGSTLAKLCVSMRLDRKKVDGRYLYCAADKEINARQLRARTAAVVARPVKRKTDEESGKMISLFFDTLNERQRRLYAGLESARLGHGGDAQMAHALQLDPATVSRGRHELLSGEVIKDRIRKPGGGRKRIEKKTSK